jgi:hypothetical protein
MKHMRGVSVILTALFLYLTQDAAALDESIMASYFGHGFTLSENLVGPEGRISDTSKRKAEKAVEHFLTGQHPFARFRHLVVKEKANALRANSGRKLWETHAAEISRTSRISFLVQPDTDDDLRFQLPLHFVLAQAFPGGLLHGIKAQSGPEADIKTFLNHVSMPIISIERLRTALIHRATYERLTDKKTPPTFEISDSSFLVLRALPFVLEGKAYPEQLIRDAERLRGEERSQIARWLIDHMPEPISNEKSRRLKDISKE